MRLKIFLLLTLVLTACGTKSDRFKIEGKFLNLNQGEFYVYSMDGSIEGMDTIKVKGGRFSYDMQCVNPSTLIIVFPNFSEQPVFAEPGAKVKIKADASHLKQLEVEGTDENELMNKFRKMIEHCSPPDIISHAETFIKDHPSSSVSLYLLQKYFVNNPQPNYDKAQKLAQTILSKTKDSLVVMTLKDRIDVLARMKKGKHFPKFTAKDVRGNTVSNNVFNGKTTVVSVWGMWNYDSQNAQVQLKGLKEMYGDRLSILSICVEPDRKTCKEYLEREEIHWPVICDELLFESPLLRQMGISEVPYNVIVDKTGTVVSISPEIDVISDNLKSLL